MQFEGAQELFFVGVFSGEEALAAACDRLGIWLADAFCLVGEGLQKRLWSALTRFGGAKCRFLRRVSLPPR